MRLHVKILLSFFLGLWLSESPAQTISPNPSVIYSAVGSSIYAISPGIPASYTLTPLVCYGIDGIAVAPAFGYTSNPNPTFWTTAFNTQLYFSNGSGFLGPVGMAALSTTPTGNIGGSKNHIYSFNETTGTVFRYSTAFGTGTPVVSVNSFSSGSASAADIVGDEDDNFYLFRGSNGPALFVFNSSGVPTCSYAVNNFTVLGYPNTNPNGFAIIGNTICVTNSSNFYVGLLSGSTINLTTTATPPGPMTDLGQRYISLTLPSTITAFPQDSLTCAQNSLVLTAYCSTLNPLTYTWSGPGLIGAVHTPTLSVYLPGVYTCSITSHGCPAKRSVSNFTVISGSQFFVPVITGPSSITCVSPTIQLSASPNSTNIVYGWNGPGIIGSGNTSSTQVNTQGIYTLSMNNTLTGCSMSTLVNVGTTIGPLNISTNPGDSYVCLPSGALSFTASGAGTYTWLPNSAISSTQGPVVTITPGVSSTYTITGTTGVCSGQTLLTIFTTLPPPLLAQANSTFLCRGQSATLTAGGAYAYTWQPGSILTESTVVTPSINTVYTVQGNFGGCISSTTIALSVDTSPPLAAAVNPSIICSGQSSTLSASGVSSYTWQGLSVANSTVLVTPSISTIYTVVGTNSIGCLDQKTLSCIVNYSTAYQATSPQSSLCSGSGIQIFANSPGATIYPMGVSGTTFNVSPATNTTYTINHSNGFCPSTSYLTLTVHPNPTLTLQYSAPAVCQGSSLAITPQGVAVSFISGTMVPGGQSLVLYPNNSYTTLVSGSSSQGCSAYATLSIAVSPTPVISASHTPSVLCTGMSMSLIAAGASSYTWSPVNVYTPSFVTIANQAMVYTLTGKTGTCSVSLNYSINPIQTPTVNLSLSQASICTGDAATLTASGAGNYTLLPGASSFSMSYLIQPNSNSTYTVLGNNGPCTSASTVGILVFPSPTLNAVSSPSTICSGDTCTISATGASNYSWMPLNLTFATITLSPVSSVVYTVQGNIGACSDSKTVQVVVLPSPTINFNPLNPTLCVGESVTLHASGASVIIWYPGPIFSTSISVSPSVSVVYTVAGTSNGCNRTNTLSLTVNPLPTLSVNNNAPLGICNGDTLLLNVTGALNYTWLPGPVNGSSYTLTNTGTYSVTGTDANSCSANTIFSVTNFPDPLLYVQASDSLVCSGESVTLSVTGANTYSWSNGSADSIIILMPLQTTQYQVLGINSNSCSSTSSFQIIVDECLGLESNNIMSENYSLFPNPTYGEMLLVLPNLFENMRYKIVDGLGRMVIDGSITSINQMLDLKAINNGLYTLIVTVESEIVYMAKVVKQ